MPRTDHSTDITNLRARAETASGSLNRLALAAAADLLELHDCTGISLDNWPSARALVETLTEHPITENGV